MFPLFTNRAFSDFKVTLRKNIRSAEIQQYRSTIRRSLLCIDSLSYLIENIPKESKQVYEWCEQMVRVLESANKAYWIEDCKTVDLFKIFQKFPNRYTLRLFEECIKVMSVEGIDQMFNYDVIGLLHKIIKNPEFYVSTLDKDQKVELISHSLSILTILCERGQKVGLFAIQNHKSFSIIKKYTQVYRPNLNPEYLRLIRSFTLHNWNYHEQYVKIVHELNHFIKNMPFADNLMNWLCTKTNASLQIALVFESLKKITQKSKKWIMQLIEAPQNIETVLQNTINIINIYLSSSCRKSCPHCQAPLKQQNLIVHSWSNPSEIQNQLSNCYFRQNIKFTSQVLNHCNLFLLTLIESTVYQDIPYQEIIRSWIAFLNLNLIPNYNHATNLFWELEIPRKHIYFFISNIFCSYHTDTIYTHLLIYDHNIISLLSQNLIKQNQSSVVQELTNAIASFLNAVAPNFVTNQTDKTLKQIIDQSNLINNLCDKIVNFGLSPSSKCLLVRSLIIYSHQYQFHQNPDKLAFFAHSKECSQELFHLIEELLKYCV